MPRLPDRRFSAALLRRALFFWLGVRLLFALAGGGGAGPYGLTPLAARATLILVLIVGLVGFLEACRRNEHLLLANFGVSQRTVAALSVLPAALAEAAVVLAARS